MKRLTITILVCASFFPFGTKIEIADAGPTPPPKSDRLTTLEEQLNIAFDSIEETTQSLKQAEKDLSAALQTLRRAQADYELVQTIGSDDQIKAARSRVVRAEVEFADATDDVVADRRRWERLRSAINKIRSQILEEQAAILKPTQPPEPSTPAPKTPQSGRTSRFGTGVLNLLKGLGVGLVTGMFEQQHMKTAQEKAQRGPRPKYRISVPCDQKVYGLERGAPFVLNYTGDKFREFLAENGIEWDPHYTIDNPGKSGYVIVPDCDLGKGEFRIEPVLSPEEKRAAAIEELEQRKKQRRRTEFRNIPSNDSSRPTLPQKQNGSQKNSGRSGAPTGRDGY